MTDRRYQGLSNALLGKGSDFNTRQPTSSFFVPRPNPYLNSARQIAGTNYMVPGMSGKDAFLVQAAQGLASGLLSGMGQEQQQEDYRRARQAELAQREQEMIQDIYKSEMQALAKERASRSFRDQDLDYQRQQAGIDIGKAYNMPGANVELQSQLAGGRAGATAAAQEPYKIAADRRDVQFAGERAAATERGRFEEQQRQRRLEAVAGAPLLSREERRKIETDLGKDFRQQPAVKNFAVLDDMFQSMQLSYDDMTRAAFLDYVIGTAKALDPNSVVRTSEGDQVIDASGLGGQLYAAYQHVKGGGKFTDTMKQELLQLVANRHTVAQEKYLQAVNFYTRRASDEGARPENINYFPERMSVPSQKQLDELYDGNRLTQRRGESVTRGGQQWEIVRDADGKPIGKRPL